MTNSTAIGVTNAVAVYPALDEEQSRKRLPSFIEAFEFFRGTAAEPGESFEDWFETEQGMLKSVPVEMTDLDADTLVDAAFPGNEPGEIKVGDEDDVFIFRPND